jgi:hypothetical protein
MVVTILKFTKIVKTCKKFNLLFKKYKIDKLANGILKEEKHECKFYEWWHQVGIIMKHVITFVNDTNLLQFESNTRLLEKHQLKKMMICN